MAVLFQPALEDNWLTIGFSKHRLFQVNGKALLKESKLETPCLGCGEWLL